MVSIRIFTIEGPVELQVQGFWMSTRLGEVVIRGDVPRKLDLWPGEGALFDPTPLGAARSLEGDHTRIVVAVGTEQLCMDRARVEMRGVTLAIRATAATHHESSTIRRPSRRSGEHPLISPNPLPIG